MFRFLYKINNILRVYRFVGWQMGRDSNIANSAQSH